MASTSWYKGKNGLWSQADNWSAGVPNASDSATISVAPIGTSYVVSIETAFTVADLLIDQKLATLKIAPNDGVGFDFSITNLLTFDAGTIVLDNGGLRGGSCVCDSGVIKIHGDGDINSFSWDGTLRLENDTSIQIPEYGSSVLLDGVSFAGLNGSGSGSLLINSYLIVSVYQAELNNVEIRLASGDDLAASSSSDSFTLGQNVELSTTGSYMPYGIFGVTYFGSDSTFFNEGKISDSSGADLEISAEVMVNSGTISVSNDSTVQVDCSESGTNTGLISVGAGGYLDLAVANGGAFTSTGTFSVFGTLGLDFTLATNQLANFQTPKGLLLLDGELINSGSTLAVGPGTDFPRLWLDGGDIIGGAIIGSDDFKALDGTLDDVSLYGTQEFSGYINIVGSLSTAGADDKGDAKIILEEDNLDFQTTTTLDNVDVTLNSSGYLGRPTTIEAGFSNESSDTTLTFGAGVTINQSATGSIELYTATSGDLLVNDGTLAATDPGAQFLVVGLVNKGYISVSNGGSFGWAPYNELASDTVLNLGTIAVNGGSLYLSDGSETLDNSGLISCLGTASTLIGLGNDEALVNNGTLSIAGGASVEFGGFQSPYTFTNNGAILATGTAGYLETINSQLINAGSIAITGGCTIDVLDGTFVNTGTMLIAGGGTLNGEAYQSGFTFGGNDATNSESFTNTGLITIEEGGYLELYAPQGGNPSSGLTWSNAGTIAVEGGQLDIGGTFKLAQIDNVVVSDGGFVRVEANGTLDISGTTLTVGGSSALGTLSLVGTIHGGTIIDQGDGIAFESSGYNSVTGTYMGADLDSVTCDGVLSIDNAGEVATITGGITLTGASGSGAGSIALTGDGAILDFASKESLSGTTSIGGIAQGSTLTGLALTLTHESIIKQAGPQAFIGVIGASPSTTSTISNFGRILANDPGGTLTIAGNFANSGNIAASDQASLVLDVTSLTNAGTISVTDASLDIAQATVADLTEVSFSGAQLYVTGTLTGTGSTLTVGSGTSLPSIGLEGTIAGGTIADSGGGISIFGNGTLAGVTYEGVLDISRPLAALTITNGLTATGSTGSGNGSIVIDGAGSVLAWDNADTLNNATIGIGNATETYGSNQLAAPALVAGAYGAGTGSPNLVDLGAQLVIDQTDHYATIGGLDSSGSVSSAGGTFVSAATIAADFSGGALSIEGASFTSTGTIAIGNGEIVTEGAASFTNAGLITIAAGSSLNLDLFNYFADAPLAPESFINAGTISLGGTITELTDNGAFPSLPELNTGLITGTGSLNSALVNNGRIVASGGTLTLGAAISGSGMLQVDARATLSLATVSSGETATFNGKGGVLGLSPPSFLGEIGGFASGDTIDLASTAATAASFSGSSIVVTLSTGNTFTLSTTAPLSGTLEATAGTHGDTLISYAAAHATPADPAIGAWPLHVAH